MTEEELRRLASKAATFPMDSDGNVYHVTHTHGGAPVLPMKTTNVPMTRFDLEFYHAALKWFTREGVGAGQLYGLTNCRVCKQLTNDYWFVNGEPHCLDCKQVKRPSCKHSWNARDPFSNRRTCMYCAEIEG